MNKVDKIKPIINIVINFVVFGLMIFVLIHFIQREVSGDPESRFIYYTNLSNIFVGLVYFINAILLIVGLVKNKLIYSKVFHIIKFTALTMILLTFFVTLLVLTPLTSFKEMYSGDKYITHLIIPVLSVGTYFILDREPMFGWKCSLFSLTTTVIYTIIYVSCVVFSKTWPDIYQINSQGL